ncbi:hypothetical protein EW145_g4463 [Phellinidium pouzarii]|uniref:Protein ROT1 n=1 Tax=Phellinidium pouzarii TaxID=167371 RepID=A0A4S4L8B3_9AGAM|nr:hypothetical protein EW145_g4463 [Phellinidium pouzarii]
MHSLHFVSLISLLLSSLSQRVDAQQIILDSIHNLTSLQGTWSTGAQNVVTGSGFANPANESFIYPKTTGKSYSFTNDGFFEIARYQFTSNGTTPSCIIGTLDWSHGTYEILDNGSIITTPFGDGYQQVQDPCAANSNLIQNFNFTELYQSWRIFQDPVTGYKLHLFEFDGTPVEPQFQVSNQPNMLPTQILRNVTPAFSTTNGFVSTGHRMLRRAGSETGAASPKLAAGAGLTVTLCAFVGLIMLAL